MGGPLNPKLVGSGIIDCIPQTGDCPRGCSECFYNGGRFYRPLDAPLIPPAHEAAGKLVRINSGHDSNLPSAAWVCGHTRTYPDRFYNTSIPKFDFEGAPVVFTCNGHEPIFLAKEEAPPNLMAVRVRYNTWDLEIQRRLISHYIGLGIPVIATWMRYYSQEAVLCPEDYEWKKHITNDYWVPKGQVILGHMRLFSGTGLRMCGTLWSSLCVDCGNCLSLYRECKARLASVQPWVDTECRSPEES